MVDSINVMPAVIMIKPIGTVKKWQRTIEDTWPAATAGILSNVKYDMIIQKPHVMLYCNNIYFQRPTKHERDIQDK